MFQYFLPGNDVKLLYGTIWFFAYNCMESSTALDSSDEIDKIPMLRSNISVKNRLRGVSVLTTVLKYSQTMYDL